MPRRPVDPDEYASKKARDNARARKLSEEARDIGPLPTVADPDRRERCRQSLRAHCLTYHPAKFFLPFSPDHLTVIDRLERAIRDGGLAAIAMPRGSGKSELAKRACEWAVLHGYRRFVVLVGATEGDAENLADDIKDALAANDLLAEDYPEACHPIRALEGIVHRAKGQLLDGKSTKLVWKQTEIRLAAIAGAACSGAVIRTVGITGAIRGATATAADGGTMRPDLVLLDDCQTRESASSPTQTETRERIIRGDVLGLAGPTTTIAAVMCCTVICQDDLSCRFLDREKSPQWHGIRAKLVKAFPTDEDLWGRYLDIRVASLKAGGDGAEATAFYLANRSAMDAGAEVAWPERFDSSRFASAVEEAMVRRQDNPAAFAAEMQNDPDPDSAVGSVRELVAAEVARRVNNVSRWEVPRDATRLTAFFDVGLKVMWYAVVAFDERFNCGLVDYGASPRQNRNYFAAADARPALSDLYPGYTEPQLVFAGLRDLAEQVLGRAYIRQGTGESVRVGQCLVDSGWNPDTVHQFCRQSPHAAILLPSKGYATTSNTRPMSEWAVKPGERTGPGWRVGALANGRGRQVIFDPDQWKSFVADRLTTPPGGAGCFQFFGDKADAHHLLADHLTAEYAIRVATRGREFDKWAARPDRRDNHLLDCVVGAAVAASVAGLVWSVAAAVGETPKAKEARKTVKLSDLVRERAGQRPKWQSR